MSLLQKQPEVTTSLVHTPLYTEIPDLNLSKVQSSAWSNQKTEAQKVDWLILHFNQWFSYNNVVLLRGLDEPEYFPATPQGPARIQFAHGFFNSALHEISHWCIAGEARRGLADLGYWYAPDGRTLEQQQLFEQVEIKPQAIEWLFATAFAQKFRVSLDNLNGDAGDGKQFKDNVYQQVVSFFKGDCRLPKDALYFIQHICASTRAGQVLHLDEFQREQLD